MDPLTAWTAMVDAERRQDWETVAEAAQSLLDWLARGGFVPRVRLVHDRPPHQQGVAVARVCRRYLRHARRHCRHP
jgi:hypothetical protein